MLPATRKLLQQRGVIDVLELNCWDLTPEQLTDDLKVAYPDVKLFTPVQAHKTLEFLDRIQADDRVGQLAIHCYAGISRSGAVATFANQYFGLDEVTFTRDHPYILPNKHILQLLTEAKQKKTS